MRDELQRDLRKAPLCSFSSASQLSARSLLSLLYCASHLTSSLTYLDVFFYMSLPLPLSMLVSPSSHMVLLSWACSTDDCIAVMFN